MKNWILYDQTTGEIRISGHCSDDDFELQAQTGLVLLEADAGPSTHYVEDGVVVAYTESQVIAKAFPIRGFGWSNLNCEWIDDRNLLEIKEQQRQYIKKCRDQETVRPKTTSHGVFDSDLVDQDNLAKVISVARIADSRGLGSTANYTLSDNTRQTFTLYELETAALEMGTQVQNAYDAADSLFLEIQNASTIAEVEQVQWPS